MSDYVKTIPEKKNDVNGASLKIMIIKSSGPDLYSIELLMLVIRAKPSSTQIVRSTNA